MSDSGVGLETLKEKMSHIGVQQEDVIEKFIRSSGPGGQKVQKTSTCVYLKHIPTGIEVKCQRERSQILNRYLAWQLLLDKIEALQRKKLFAERQRIEKIKRQRRKRPKALKLKILETKRRRAEKKMLRAKIKFYED